jgi:hypothetical protein
MASPSDMIVYDNSLRPSAQKSVVRKFADMLTMGMATDALRSAERSVGVGHVAAALHTVRGNGEAGVVGLGLGVLSGMGGLDRKGVPYDLAASGLAAAGGIVFSHHEVGITLRQASAAAMAIFTFRKTEEWLGVRKKASFGGEDWQDPNTIDVTSETDLGEDPIVAAARAL